MHFSLKAEHLFRCWILAFHAQAALTLGEEPQAGVRIGPQSPFGRGSENTDSCPAGNRTTSLTPQIHVFYLLSYPDCK
jgi:hypothetical protein